MPVALWLGVREFAGVWINESRPRIGRDEVFSFLGDARLAVLADAMTIYGLEPSRGVAWSPGWYRDNFVHWALQYVRLPAATIESIVFTDSRRTPTQELSWCGVAGCPYPYVTVGAVRLSSPSNIDPNATRESRSPEINPRTIRPQWGAYVHGPSMVNQSRETNGVSDSGSDSETT